VLFERKMVKISVVHERKEIGIKLCWFIHGFRASRDVNYINAEVVLMSIPGVVHKNCNTFLKPVTSG
jgi:hypothetical protein